MGDKLARRVDLRLPEFDYSSPGIYFVTIVQKHQLNLFGSVNEEGVQPNNAGRMVIDCWENIPDRYPWVELDEFVLMPNHLHGLLVFGADPDFDERVNLGTVIGSFKSITTNAYGLGVRSRGWPRFNGKLWLENYYERVVRNDREAEKFREYIWDNPYRWLEKRDS